MDVLYFLKERTKFIRHFYKVAGAPFRETIREIEAGEAPFEPPCSEIDEPPFLEEWLEAEMALELLGRSCISMLSGSLKLYFKTWEGQLGLTFEQKNFKDVGFVHGYRVSFGEALGLDWNDCPVDFDVIEQIVLARNTDQHPGNISTFVVRHREKYHTKIGHLFFVREIEKSLFSESDGLGNWWMDPPLYVSRDSLIASLEQVEVLGEWLEIRMIAAKYPSAD